MFSVTIVDFCFSLSVHNLRFCNKYVVLSCVSLGRCVVGGGVHLVGSGPPPPMPVVHALPVNYNVPPPVVPLAASAAPVRYMTIAHAMSAAPAPAPTVCCFTSICHLKHFYCPPVAMDCIVFVRVFFCAHNKAAFSLMIFCTNRVCQPHEPYWISSLWVKGQGHFSSVGQSLPNCFHLMWKKIVVANADIRLLIAITREPLHLA